MQDIVEWHHLSVHFCDDELVSEFTMDSIGKIDWSGSLRKSDDVSFWSEDKYLICEHVHVHFFHEFTSFHTMFYDIFDGFYPIAIC